jgi:hypothetical protein
MQGIVPITRLFAGPLDWRRGGDLLASKISETLLGKRLDPFSGTGVPRR